MRHSRHGSEHGPGGHGHGEHPRERHPHDEDSYGDGGRGGRGARGRGRAHRGDVRTAVMLVLASEPMHGYSIMQTITERSGGGWRPSPGAVYPCLASLEEEGLVTTREQDGRRLATLTAAGHRDLATRQDRLGDPFADFVDGTNGPDLRSAVDELQAAARLITTTGSPAQAEAAATVLARARRALYLVLAGEPDDTP